VSFFGLFFAGCGIPQDLPLKPVAGLTAPPGCPMFAPAYVGRKRWAKPTTAFSTEGRRISFVAMMLINATGLDRRSWGA
jgi:hypothetical protein